MVAYSVLYTWFWVVTGGRLVIAVLLHSATNVAGLVLLTDARSDFGPTAIATVLTVAVAAVAARHLRRASHTSCEAIEREAAKAKEDAEAEATGGDVGVEQGPNRLAVEEGRCQRDQ